MKKKVLLIVLAIAIVVFAGYFLIHFYFVFGEGVKAGQLNYVVKKGYIFKTYEGKLIQSGIQSETPGSVGSYEFEFSVSDKNVAEELMRAGGRYVELHYKEYFGAIPWRGYSKYVVDNIVNIKDAVPSDNPFIQPNPVETNAQPARTNIP